MMIATEKQIEFATDISEMLGKDLPEELTAENLKSFIDENVEEYYSGKLLPAEEFQIEEHNIDNDAVHIIKSLACVSGVYILYNKKRIVYIGKSYNLAKRIIGSIVYRDYQDDITHFSYIEVDKKTDCDFLEMYLISKYKPILNIEYNHKEETGLLSELDIDKKYNVKRLKKYKVKWE